MTVLHNMHFDIEVSITICWSWVSEKLEFEGTKTAILG